MITLGGRQLCESCFTNIGGEPCPVCGFSKVGYAVKPGVMPVGSILIGKYVIGQVIGQGGFGITYRAYDIKREQIIAIKEYYPTTLAARLDDRLTVAVTSTENDQIFRNGIEKFYEEARLVSRFNGNPNIVSVYEFFYENNTAYFAMEFLEGITLKAYVKEKSVLSPAEALYIFSEVSNALMIAHSANILHRDISPDNIMLCGDGRVKLIDFGAARQVLADNPKSMSVILKEGFAPLEQYQKRGNQGPWTDIYSLGATVYYALTRDFLDDPMTRLEDDHDFEINKYEIEEQLWNVIRKCSKLKIDERYQSAFELKEALKEIKYKPSPVTVHIPEAAQSASFNPDMNAAAPVTGNMYNGTAVNLVTGNTYNGTVGAPAAGNTYNGNAAGNTYNGNTAGFVGGNTYSKNTAGGGFQGIDDVYGQFYPDNTGGTKKRFKYKALIIAGSAILCAILIVIGIIVAVNSSNRNNTYNPNNPYLPVVENPTEEPTEKPTEKIEQITIGKLTYASNIEQIDLTEEDLTNYDIKNLPKFKNLKIIILNDNNINDLSVLSEMPQVEGIWFDGNRVSDLSFVKGMKNLKHISFAGNNVYDLSPLEGTTKLETFWANDNRISDLSPLKENKNMTEVGINHNPIGGDISALSAMTELTWLSAEGCGITDLYSLRRCINLKDIYIGRNSIESVAPLKNCTGIINLFVDNNTPQDKEGFIDSFAGITMADDARVNVTVEKGVDGYIFDSEDDAEIWSTTINWGSNGHYSFNHYN